MIITTSHLLALVITSTVLAAGVGLLLHTLRSQLRATRVELDIAHGTLRTRNEEIAHLRLMQARKIDRALFMLASVRRANAAAVSVSAEDAANTFNFVLAPQIIATMQRDEQAGEAAFGSVLAQHLARRVVKTATATEGQRT